MITGNGKVNKQRRLIAATIISGTLGLIIGCDNSESNLESGSSETVQAPAVTTAKPEPVQPPPKVSVDPDIFCQQLTDVGDIFNKEFTGGRVRENASYGPKAACSWSGPNVTVFFGDKSYHRMRTGFGSDIYVEYEGLDFPAFKKETSTSTAGYEIRVKSEKGWTISINDGRGLKENLTPEQYNKIANIVNDVLNKHY